MYMRTMYSTKIPIHRTEWIWEDGVFENILNALFVMTLLLLLLPFTLANSKSMTTHKKWDETRESLRQSSHIPIWLNRFFLSYLFFLVGLSCYLFLWTLSVRRNPNHAVIFKPYKRKMCIPTVQSFSVQRKIYFTKLTKLLCTHFTIYTLAM